MNNDGIILVVLAMAFAAIVLLGQAAYFYVKSKRDDEQYEIRRRLGFQAEADEEEALASLLRERAADTMLDRLGNFGESIHMSIRAAGMNLTVSQLFTYMLVAALVASVVLFVGIGVQAMPLGLMAGYLPYWFVNKKAVSRAKSLLDQMPDSLEMMGRAMQAGAGLVDCFRLVQDEMSDPVAAEFGRVADEVRFGKDWREALEQLIERNPTLFELRLLVSSLLLQRDTGGNMIETVNRVAKLIRQRAAFDQKVKAMTSEARASGLVLALMPLGVLVMIMMANAPYLEPLTETTLGHMVIVYAVASYAFGLFIMSVSSKVEA